MSTLTDNLRRYYGTVGEDMLAAAERIDKLEAALREIRSHNGDLFAYNTRYERIIAAALIEESSS